MSASSDVRPTGPGMPFPPVNMEGAGTGSSLVGKVAVVLTALIGAVVFVGALVVIVAVALVAILVALCVVAIRGALHALAPRSGGHRVAQGGFRPAAVIETTAKVIRSSAPKPRP
jgi:hypothetical protein